MNTLELITPFSLCPRNLGGVLLLGATLLGAGCSSTKSPDAKATSLVTRPDFVHPQFVERRTSLHHVALVEPRLDVMLMTYGGKKTLLSNETATVSMVLPGLIGAQLIQRGFAVQPPLPLEVKVLPGASSLGASNELAQARTRAKEWLRVKPWRTSRLQSQSVSSVSGNSSR